MCHANKMRHHAGVLLFQQLEKTNDEIELKDI